jgi:hypothetical protein
VKACGAKLLSAPAGTALGFDVGDVAHQLSNSSLFRSGKPWQLVGIVQQSKGGDPMSSGILRTAMSRSLGFMADLPLVGA